MEKIDRIFFRVSTKEKEEYKKMAYKLDCSMSEFIRQACQEKIENMKKELKNGCE